ncbi:MAG: APC family permease [Phycisphaerales bacterium]|jgi:APA family basic amino acid/polyamine antiporter|nr:APC family permease [Phycisphaerales bacterium]
MSTPRHLSVFSGIGICAASMIGSGIFTVTGFIGPSLGTNANVLLAWLLGGLLSLAGALTVAELAANRPVPGALYVAARETLGPRLGFVNGVVTVLVGYIAAAAFIASVLGTYVASLVPGLPPMLTALLLVGALTALHGRWLRSGARINDAMAALKVVVLLAFAIAGLLVTPADPIDAPAIATPPAAWSAAVGAAVVSISFAYLGWSAAADVAGELKRPARSIPMSIVSSVVLVTGLYLLVNVAYLRAVTPQAMVDPESGEPMADIGAVASTALFGSAIGTVMTLAIIAILLSTLSTMLFTGGRVLVSMARQGEAPAMLERAGPHGAPAAATWAQALLIIPFIVLPTLGGLLEYIGLLITFAASMSGFAVLVRRARGEPRVWSMPAHPVPVAVFLLLSGWLAASAAIDTPMTAVYSGGTLLLIILLRPVLARQG